MRFSAVAPALLLFTAVAAVPALAQDSSSPVPASDANSTSGNSATADNTQTAPSPPPAKPVAVVLRGLDKITGRATDIVAPIDKPVQFATLTITARTCYSTPPTEPPETTAFLQISDKRPGQAAKQVFSGWMFASTPSINGMEHPLYDVWVITCKTNAPGVVASVTPAKGPAKVVSPNAEADEPAPSLPEGAGQ
jgi:hypothetical protein